jgi:alcohol dehydrogenase class IV
MSSEPDLPRRNVVDIVEKFGASDVEAIVGIGGGSCMDLDKVASAVLTHGGDVRDYYGQFLVRGPGIPVITVPTTGGTGAEDTCIPVVFDEDKEMKIGVAKPYLKAYAAIIDPELPLTCPPRLTAASGADALSHLIASFTGRARNPDPGNWPPRSTQERPDRTRGSVGRCHGVRDVVLAPFESVNEFGQ